MTAPFDPAALVVAAIAPVDDVSVAIGAHPSAELVGMICRLVVKRHPHGGRSLEQALREAVFLGWGARDALRPGFAGSGDGFHVPLPASDHPSEETHV